MRFFLMMLPLMGSANAVQEGYRAAARKKHAALINFAAIRAEAFKKSKVGNLCYAEAKF